jgi:hypothetical protein
MAAFPARVLKDDKTKEQTRYFAPLVPGGDAR